MFRLHPPAPAQPHCMILAIDDATFGAMGGVAGYRTHAGPGARTAGSRRRPQAVAVDMVLADQEDAAEDERLAERHARRPRIWCWWRICRTAAGKIPLPVSFGAAASLGHDRADENSRDGVTRQIPLEERTATARHWSLALEAFRLARGRRILESPQDLQIGDEVIPAGRTSDGNRPLRVLYTVDPIPQISLKDLVEKPELAERFRGQVVFIGVTSISASYDRVATPFGQGRIPGVEVHAQPLRNSGTRPVPDGCFDSSVLGFCLLTGVLAGLIFAFLSGWPAYLAAGALLIAVPASPFLLFRQGIVFPFFAPLASAWLTCVAAASYQHFVVRRAAATSPKPSASATSRPSISSRTRCARRSPPFRDPAN